MGLTGSTTTALFLDAVPVDEHRRVGGTPQPIDPELRRARRRSLAGYANSRPLGNASATGPDAH